MLDVGGVELLLGASLGFSALGASLVGYFVASLGASLDC